MAARWGICVLVLVVVVGGGRGETPQRHGILHPRSPTPGRPNTHPINTEPPVFVGAAPHGKLYAFIPGGVTSRTVWLLHVWGTPYEQGYAQGILLRKQIAEFIPQAMDRIRSEASEYRAKVPPWMRDVLDKEGIDVVLDVVYALTQRYTGSNVWDELKGIADGSGVDYDLLRRFHMFPEFTKGDCSMFGAWGDATASGHLLQLRALDWDVEGPFKNYPLIVVYHNDEATQGHSFVSFTFCGFVGLVTGVSAQKLGMSEIGVGEAEGFGKESRMGTPFVFLMRDVLQFEDSSEGATKHIVNANRTCNLLLGVGDGKTDTFRGYQISSTIANVYDDTNLQPLTDWHPRIENVVYWGMSWTSEDQNLGMAQQLTSLHGNLTAENAIRDVMSMVRTGNLQSMLFDPSTMTVWFALAAQDADPDPDRNAYDRAYTRVDLKALFAERV